VRVRLKAAGAACSGIDYNRICSENGKLIEQIEPIKQRLAGEREWSGGYKRRTRGEARRLL
jgi:hypothetical protein